MPWLLSKILAKFPYMRRLFCISGEGTTYDVASLSGGTSEDEDGLRAATAATTFQVRPCIQRLATDPTTVWIVCRRKSKSQGGEDWNRKELHFEQLVKF